MELRDGGGSYMIAQGKKESFRQSSYYTYQHSTYRRAAGVLCSWDSTQPQMESNRHCLAIQNIGSISSKLAISDDLGEKKS